MHDGTERSVKEDNPHEQRQLRGREVLRLVEVHKVKGHFGLARVVAAQLRKALRQPATVAAGSTRGS
jgi:hypothetical protein